MERTLQVLDYAVLLISGPEGIQGHTITLWKLLKIYKIPTFVFVNKMDRPGSDENTILKELRDNFGEEGIITPLKEEDMAMSNEELMEEYFTRGNFSDKTVSKAISRRNLFPVSFGSALKMEGITEFLDILNRYTLAGEYGESFGAIVYKISRDKHGNRLTHMKITGGTLKNKMPVSGGTGDGVWEEKTEQIRIYSGESFEMVQSAKAGSIVSVIGLSKTYAGERLGKEKLKRGEKPVLCPSLTYQVILPDGTDSVLAFQNLRILEEEDPSLNVIRKEKTGEIHVQVMGDLELEVLKNTIKERFDLEVSFGEGSIVYKETIKGPSYGIGHYEPLRHYAEVQILLEPLPRGRGLVIDTDCSLDKLDRNWQRLIVTHLQEKNHYGVLTGSEITDMRITLTDGKAHLKHTEGGDFRQATYRAVRQGLRKAESILLEPYYKLRIEIPVENVGRCLSDMQKLGARAALDENYIMGDDKRMSVILGEGPVRTLKDYQREVAAYSSGLGRFSAIFDGYKECKDQNRIVEMTGYNPEADLENPTGSVFCSHGASFYVPWDEVDAMAHTQINGSSRDSSLKWEQGLVYSPERGGDFTTSGEKELEEIFLRTYGKSKRDEAIYRKKASLSTRKPKETEVGNKDPRDYGDFSKSKEQEIKLPLYIIDGYNVLFAWQELNDIARVNIDSARETLLEIMSNYQGYKKVDMIVVFDGYKLSGNPGSKDQYNLTGNYAKMQVIYTKEAQTADRFIEKTVYELGKKRNITVVTSDRPVQMAALGDGATRMSSREFKADVLSVSEEIREKLRKQTENRNRPFEGKL